MPRRVLAALLTLSVLFSLTSPASAQDPHDPRQEAEAHYQTAVRLFGEGRYREALDEFDAAIEVHPEAIFYCNRAVVLIQLGESRDALDSFETCQKTFGGDSAELAEIDAQRQAVATFVEHVRPSARETVSRINAPGPVAPQRPNGWTQASTGYLLAGIGVGFVGSAAVLDVLSADLKQEFVDESFGPRGSSQESYDALRRRYVARQRLWIGLTAAGAVFTLSGVTLAALHLFGNRSDEGPQVSGLVGGRPGISVRWRW